MKCWSCHREVATREPRCPHCGRWGTVSRWRKLGDVERSDVERMTSGIAELDALLGGGFVPGCVYRLSGAPGSGKSTLALDVASRLASAYAAAEEAASSIRLRFDRIAEETGASVLIAEVATVEEVADVPHDVRFVVVDSLHRLRSPAVPGPAGCNGQLLHATEQLVAVARKRGLVVLAIGHVNREGDASGTTGVDHDVDALLEMIGADDETDLAKIIVRKNRHGPAPLAMKLRLHEGGIEYAPKEEGIEHQKEGGQEASNRSGRRTHARAAAVPA